MLGQFHKPIDVGTVFGRLEILKQVEVSDGGHAQYLCRCACGKKGVFKASSVRRGKTTSCGCFRSERAAKRIGDRLRTHGLSEHRLFNIHKNIMDRCFKKECKAYQNYGGRGITVCERWKDVSNFVADMDSGFEAGMTIERINNEGHYEPENCRWATRKDQGRNTRVNVFVEFCGQRKTIAEWAEEIGIPMRTLWARFNRGMLVEKALTMPLDTRKRRSVHTE